MFEVRVVGPDDVHTHDSELSALRHANEINLAFLADLLTHPNPADQVLCVATVQRKVLLALPVSDGGVLEGSNRTTSGTIGQP